MEPAPGRKLPEPPQNRPTPKPWYSHTVGGAGCVVVAADVDDSKLLNCVFCSFSDSGCQVAKKFSKITQKGLQKISFGRGIVFFGK